MFQRNTRRHSAFSTQHLAIVAIAVSWRDPPLADCQALNAEWMLTELLLPEQLALEIPLRDTLSIILGQQQALSGQDQGFQRPGDVIDHPVSFAVVPQLIHSAILMMGVFHNYRVAVQTRRFAKADQVNPRLIPAPPVRPGVAGSASGSHSPHA